MSREDGQHFQGQLCLSFVLHRRVSFGPHSHFGLKVNINIVFTVKGLAGNPLRIISNGRLVIQKETEAVICKGLPGPQTQPGFQSLGVLFHF
jgi:hypothetical protein